MKKKVAVLHAQVPFIRGGAELMVESLTKQLKLRGFDAELVSMPFKWYPVDTALMDSQLMWRLADLTEVGGEKIDLVIAAKSPTYLIQHPNKVIWLMHQHRAAYDLRDNIPAGGLNTIPGGKGIIEKLVHMDCQAITEACAVYSISKTVSQRLKYYNGLDSTPLYHPPALAGRYFSEEYGSYVLSVGRLDPMKRTSLLIQALPYCDEKIRAVVAGRGAEMDKLKKLAADLGVSGRVDFLGFVPDEELVKLYANALAVYFAPIDEDYGYITLEAFLSKRPVVTCEDSGGVLEFAKDGENAFVCSHEQPEQIGRAVQRLYENKHMAEDFGVNGHEVVKDFSWDTVIDELTKTIR